LYSKLAEKLHVDSPPGLVIRPFVFYASAALILCFVALSLIFFDQADAAYTAAKGFVTANAGWFLILTVSSALVFILYLNFSRFGKIRLGGPDTEPDFSRWGWFAMLFSAGMGIGLIFWSVAEPIYHFASPPLHEAESVSAARQSMVFTFYHWGLHAWGIYALVGLSLAFFSYNCGLPLTIRSAFYPLFGKKVNGLLGDVIDTLAVVATLFGVATSLGLGVQQVNAGLGFLVESIPTNDVSVQIALIAGITLVATISVVKGVDAGIRRLSELNMWFAGALLLAVLIFGPTHFIFDSFVQNIGAYFQQLPRLSFWTQAYTPEEQWLEWWTVFYWAWWIAWSPFVGMFIARISKGRTISEFITGVLLVPTLLTFIWLSVFGSSAIFDGLFNDQSQLAKVVVQDDQTASALFVMFQGFPLTSVLSAIAVIVVILFFVTSSDSGSLVIDIITAGGYTDPPVRQRIFWAVAEGIVAAILLLGGGLEALQTASVVTGLPFAVVLIIMAIGLHRGLVEYEKKVQEKT
jgi:choline/glycine/proline betaine transport protein